MKKEEKKQLIESLKQGKENNFKSPFDDNPEAKRELLVGQLRSLKFAHLGRMKRKNLQGKEADSELDKYNKQREELIANIDKEGFEYTEGEENDEKYKNFDM